MKALSPLFIFLILYLATSIIAQDFYKVPIAVAFLVSSVYALLTVKGTMNERIKVFAEGAGNPTMVLMLAIFILAGAFAQTARVIGAIDATVNLSLTLLPGNMLLAGLFLASCFISLSVGTSVGTIVALTPIAAGVAEQTGSSVALLTAVVVGGSFFGDNLSFISDTTIAATQTQGCRLSDKFRANSFIVVPAAFVVFMVYIFMGTGMQSPQHVPEVSFVKVIPYLLVLLTAIFGMNVMAVLALGILSSGAIGLLTSSFDFYGWMGAMGEGIVGMGELIIITQAF